MPPKSKATTKKAAPAKAPARSKPKPPAAEKDAAQPSAPPPAPQKPEPPKAAPPPAPKKAVAEAAPEPKGPRAARVHLKVGQRLWAHGRSWVRDQVETVTDPKLIKELQMDGSFGVQVID